MSDNPRAMQHLAEAAAQILEAAADDGRPVPSTLTLHARVDVVDIRFDDPADVYLWAQWRGIADRDVKVLEGRTSSKDMCVVEWRGEIYDQPVYVWSMRRVPETVDWETPARDEVPV